MKKNRILVLLWIIFLIAFQLKVGGYLANLMTVFTLVALILSILLVLPGRAIAIDLEAGTDAGKGEEIPVRLRIKASSGLRIGWLECKLSFENAISGEKKEKLFLMPMGMSKVYQTDMKISDQHAGEIRVEVTAQRGLDLFKLVSRKMEAKAYDSCIVRPNMMPIPPSKDALYSYDMESYVYSGDKKGNDPSDTFGIREYIPGDNPKTIHWKLTGKMGDLVVRELGLPVDNKVLIILNNRQLPNQPLEPGKRDSLIETFFGIAQGITNQGLDFSVGWYDSQQGEFYQKPVEGNANIYGIMRGVLSAPFYTDEISVVQRFLTGTAQRSFASYIYVTAYEDVEVQRLEQYGAVHIQGR